MANKTLKIHDLKQTIIITTDKKKMMVNKCGLPLNLKVPKGYIINKQAKRDSKTSYGHSVCDSLFLSAYERASNSDMNSGHSVLVGIELYWSGYARGVREQRQAQRDKKVTAFDLIGADDIQALSSEIGVDPNILANGVMEIIAKQNSGVNK
ncbi:hypothetical protein RU86_GL001649 [Lactococcus piscium]|uniref:Uncharacterized protein n=1 Tax=Pseudolactococcus piscium TaxID=1364 RepID=A0A2A5RUG0_9LACT|nr:hypothetical protein [Lactococcus piscium]PCS04302.1 hypothetical protein RU86_GL001649 [Lactococcus piscium]